MLKTGFSFLLLITPFCLLAQAFTPNPDWRFENFNSQNHFISRAVNNITMDKYGYVWTCSGGVERFDGYRTTEFSSFDQAKGGLRDNYTDIIADNDGRIWVSSAGLCYYDDAGGKFVYVEPGPGRTITYAYALSIQKDQLWFVCDFGLAKLDLKSLKISFTSLINIKDALTTYPLDENTLLISSRQKVYVYDIKKDTYTVSTLIYNQSFVKIFAIIKSGGDIFLGTNLGLFAFKNFRNVVLVSKETENVPVGDLLFLPADKEKKYLFLATVGKGVLVYSTALKKIEFTYAHDDNNPFSLENNIVSKFYADKNGRLWISTVAGISMLDVSNQQWRMRFLNTNNADEWRTAKIARDKFDSTKVWMSSFNQGMLCLNWRTQKIEKVFNKDPELLKVLDFEQLSQNKWLLVTQKKIMEWSPQAGFLTKNKLPVPDSLSLLYNIRNIIMAGLNTGFITTDKGLFKYDLYTHRVSSVSVNNVYKKEEDLLKYDLLNGFYDKGTLWIASRNGLFSYNIATNTTAVYRGLGAGHNYYFFDVAAAADNLVICAAANGIAIFNKQTKSFKVKSSIAGLYNPPCVTLINVNNMIWIGTGAGILNYNPYTYKSARAENEVHVVAIYPTSPFAAIGNDIVFGIRNGYAYFKPDPSNIAKPSDPVIEEVSANNQLVFQHHLPQSTAKRLKFSHDDNSINITFTSFLYNDPGNIKFRYRLNSPSAGWQYATDQRSANYAQLEPGDYTFYVQSGNKNGVWNNHQATFSFVITPPYWETWWFRILVIVLIAFALYRLYRYRIKNILAIQKIRERIASDFHDDIGSALSSISIFSEVADTQLEEKLPHEQTREIVGHISYYSRNMLDAMDDIIWAVNPKNDQFNDLAVRMREFAIPLLEAKGIQFDISIDENILNSRIKMEARKNIFLVFKESINNLLKHSGCSAVKLSVSKLNNQLELVISDNGKGFDINAPHSRNGLKNMQKRAEEINGALVVTTQQGKGTVTRLIVDIV